MRVPEEDRIAEYYEMRKQLDQMAADFREVITHPSYSLPFLQVGRLVKVKHGKVDYGWGVVINVMKRLPPKNRPALTDIPPHEQYIVDVLLNCSTDSPNPKGSSGDKSNVSLIPAGVQPCPPGKKGMPYVVPILLAVVDGISHLRINLPKDLRPESERQTVWKTILEVHKRFPQGVTMLDPIQNMGIKDEKFKQLVKVSKASHNIDRSDADKGFQKIEAMEDKMFSSSIHKDPRLPELYAQYSKKVEVQDRIRNLKKQIQATEDVLQLEELKCRKRVLRRLGFTTANDIVDVKGRVACEISTGDELLLTELVFNGVFNSLTPEQCAALLSCFVFDEKVRHLVSRQSSRSLTYAPE